MSAISGMVAGLASGWARSNAGTPASRRASSRRVTLVLGAMFLMGMGDLLCTLTYMRSIGLPELNPIARWIVSNCATTGLVLYKLLTISISCGTLYLVRDHRRAEMCAWVCAAILFVLTMHWVAFNRDVTQHTNWITLLAANEAHPPINRAVQTQDIWVMAHD